MYFHHVMLYLLQNETVHSPNRFEICKYETLFAIRYHLHNLENMNNTYGDVTFSKVVGLSLQLY